MRRANAPRLVVGPAALLLTLLVLAVPAGAQGCDPFGDVLCPPEPPPPPPPEVCDEEDLAVSPAGAVAEGAGTMRFTISVGGDFPCPVDFTFATSDGTATAGEDYSAVSGEGGLNAEETEMVVEVPVLDDALDEADEAVSLVVSGVAGAAGGTITDDDDPPILSATGGEAVAGGVASFVLTLSEPSGLPVSVGYTTPDGKSGTASFAPGTTSQVVSVPVPAGTGDRYALAFSAPQGAILATPTATATITGAGGEGGGEGGDGALPIPPLPPAGAVQGPGPAIAISTQPVQGDGLVTWVVTCPATTPGGCSGVIRLRTTRAYPVARSGRSAVAAAAKRRKRNLGSQSFALKPGESKPVGVKVNTTGRRLVQRNKRVRVRATFKTRDRAGKVSTRRQDFTLREIAFRHSR